MRRVLALTCFALLAACGSQDGDPVAEATSAPDQAQAASESEATDSENPTEMDGSVEEYVEDAGDEFGDPMSEGEADLADASAPMDDAQGIDPHAEMDYEEPSGDY